MQCLNFAIDGAKEHVTYIDVMFNVITPFEQNERREVTQKAKWCPLFIANRHRLRGRVFNDVHNLWRYVEVTLFS